MRRTWYPPCPGGLPKSESLLGCFMKETASFASISALLEAFLERAGRDPEQVALLQQLALSILETYPVEPKEEKLAQAEALTPQVTDTEIDALIES
jgi:hypothetical protein